MPTPPKTSLYRKLTDDEIRVLTDSGCTFDDPASVYVESIPGTFANNHGAADNTADAPAPADSLPFTARNVSFRGTVHLAARCRLTDSELWDCTVGPDTEITDVELLRGYIVGSHCRIRNCGPIISCGDCSAHRRISVNVLDETGGRQIRVCPETTAQTAYMAAFYRHDPALVAAIDDLVKKTAENRVISGCTVTQGVTLQSAGSSVRDSFIADNVTVTRVTAMTNVDVGLVSEIIGAGRLENGTIAETAEVHENASASNFILSENAVLGNSCIIENVFLGQRVRLDAGFVARDSVIFANSTLECGEAEALFAGPHTVSHHRSTLLIAAATSFFNAGSGTNQSNHYYRTGPIHHGILERGCKTGSNAYVKWPARFGLFTVVVGSHVSHPDTSSLPFSYAFGNNGETTVIPGANLRTCGMMRDVLKWHDSRTEGVAPVSDPLDCISYEEFTPVGAERMFRGIALLERIKRGEADPATLRFTVSAAHAETGLMLYDLALRYFFGRSLVERILSLPEGECTPEKIHGPAADFDENSPWVDLAGMIAPRALIDGLCRRIASRRLGSLSEVNAAVRSIHENYPIYRWFYVRSRLTRVFGPLPPDRCVDPVSGTDVPGIGTLAEIIRRWGVSVQELRHLRAEDALRDFSPEMTVGFGIDHPEFAAADRDNSLGLPDDNPHLRNVHARYDEDTRRAALALERLNRA